jgi:hypothetical protein
MSGFKVNFSVNNQLATPSIHAAALANRPAAGQPGRVFIDTDNPSTGIYRDTGAIWVQIAETTDPEADTLQTVTDRGNTTTQDVAIGTNSTPSAPLDVHGTDTIAILQGTGTSNAFLQFNKSGNGRFKTGNVHNGGNDYFTVYNMQENSDSILVNISTNNVAIGGGVVAPSYRLDVQGSFRTTGAAYLNTSGGNVGIGTTSVNSSLEIYKASGPNYIYLTNGTSGTNNGVVLRYNSVDYMGMIGSFTTGELKVGGLNASGYFMTFYSNNAERMRLTPSGRLLLGTSTESTYLLDVNGTARILTGAVANGFVIQNTAGNTHFSYNGTTGNSTIYTFSSQNISTSTGGWLNVNGSRIQMYNSAKIQGYQQATIFEKAYPGFGGNIGFIYDNDIQGTPPAASAYKINQFKFSGTEVAYITGEGGAYFGGSVGIGTTSPNASALLDVSSTTKGVKFPSMTTAEKNAIANTAGLVVFDTTLAKLCVNSGAGWETITSV